MNSNKSAGSICRVTAMVWASLVVSLSAAWADDLVLGFAGAMGGNEYDQGTGVAVDGEGNLYSTGTFRGTVDLDPGPGVFNITSDAFIEANYICKLNVSGEFQWAYALGGGGIGAAPSVAVEGMEGVLLTGGFFGSVDFDPGPGVFTLSTGGNERGFICKLDASGTFQWAAAIGTGAPSVGMTRPVSIAVDKAGNIFTTGFFKGTADFDPGTGIFNLETAGLADEIFVCKLDALGSFEWAGAMGGNDNDRGTAIALDAAGNVYHIGFFRGTADFDPGPSDFELISTGNSDFFVCKLNNSGAFQWAGAMGGIGDDRDAHAIATDNFGNVFVTGGFGGSADFDPGPGTYFLTSPFAPDVFVCNLDNSGRLLWASAIGGSNLDEGCGVAVDGTGGIYVTGFFGSSVDFDPGPGTTRLNSIGGTDVFVWKLDASGTFQWTETVGGDWYDQAKGLAINGNGDVYITGSFSSSADFDPGAGEYSLYSVGDYDAIVMKLEPQSLPVASNETTEVNADQVVSILLSPSATSVLENDTDSNSRYTLTVFAFDATSLLGATVLMNPDGTFVYDPTSVAVFQALIPGESMTDSFTYTVSDGTDSAVGTVTITVYGAGTMLPALAAWGVGLLCATLAGLGIRACRLR